MMDGKKQRAVWDNVSARGKPRRREKEQQEGSTAQDSDVIFVPPGPPLFTDAAVLPLNQRL